MLTRTDELTGTRVTATLERLAERRVSGVMEIDGDPAGTICLHLRHQVRRVRHARC